jgi:predicted dinucleotide-binding enzyme
LLGEDTARERYTSEVATMTDKSELLASLQRVHRVMTAAHEGERKMFVYKDDVEAIEAAIKIVEKMGDET